MVKSTAILAMILCFILGGAGGAALAWHFAPQGREAERLAQPIQPTAEKAGAAPLAKREKISTPSQSLIGPGPINMFPGTNEKTDELSTCKSEVDSQATEIKFLKDKQSAGQNTPPTVLYEPGTAFNIPLFNGIVSIPISGGNAVPKWFIPRTVMPSAIGQNTQGYLVGYYDKQTHTVSQTFPAPRLN